MRRVDQRRATVRALRRLQAVVDACAHASDRAAATAVVADALVETLGLEACWYEAAPAASDLPELRTDGELSMHVQRRNRDGLVLPPAVALAAPGGARFVLVGDPGVGVPPERLLVAVLLAGALAVAPVRG